MIGRILHVSQPGDGGVASVVSSYADLQVRAGYEVAVACPPQSSLSESTRRAGATVLDWPATREPSRSTRNEAGHLRDLATRWMPDVVHLHSSKAGLAGRIGLHGLAPIAFQPHAWSFHAMTESLSVLGVAWERWAQHWTDVTICVSEAERELGRRHRIGGDLVVIPNQVDPNLWTPVAQPAARRDAGVPEEVPVAVCVARICEQKGQDLLLAMWPAVRRHLPTARLILVGDGPMREELARGARAGVTFAGTQDPRPYVAAADVIVAPSRWEGMALAPLEAQAAGRVVVAFDVDGIRESLGEMHDLVPVGDMPRFAERLVSRLSAVDGTRRMGALARTESLRRWQPERQLKQLLRAYDVACAHFSRRHGR